jgi:predicted AAA+ superfamily ATPase
VLVGQRRSGKSYILRQVGKQLLDNGVKPENMLFINREFAEMDFLRTYKDLDDLIKQYKKSLRPRVKYLFLLMKFNNRTMGKDCQFLVARLFRQL